MTTAVVLALLSGAGALPARAADPLVVISVAASGTTTLCDTNCVTCTVGSGECVVIGEEDLALCKPTSSGIPITACDWSLFMDGDAADLQINQQIRALDVAPNGNLTMVVLNDTVVPGVSNLKKQDIAVLNPADLLKPYFGGGPYDDGTFKLYLNGNLSQETATAKPWDSVAIMSQGPCAQRIDATSTADYNCPIVGSLTSGATSGSGLDGVHFENEDLVRCIPVGFSGGTVEDCTFEMFLEADRINGVGNGITGDIEAIDFLSFTPSTMVGQMVFKMSGGNPPGFPAHDNGKDLLLYDGTFGAGLCVPSNQPCAGIEDCPITDTECDTGTCAIGGLPCASDDDCASGTCSVTRAPTATVTKYFDGVLVGLSGSGQNIEAFAIVPEDDGDGVPDGFDNCPDDANPPSECSGAGAETCPSGLSSACPMGETCVQPDADGDGVGDQCDQCNGRPDLGTCDACPGAPCPAACAGSPTNDCGCGDGIADFPAEECDLGLSNGSGSPCSLTCTITGTCTRAMTACSQGSDCPQFAAGEGCCGDNVRDDADGPGGVVPDEDCDDGNDVDDDLCDNVCKAVPGGIAILGCEDLTGPNILPAAIKVTKFKDTSDAPDFDRWKAKGEAIFATGLTIDPDSEDVRLIYNNTPSGELFSSTLAPGSFVQSNPKLKWKFKDKEADVPGSPGWRKGKFTIKSNKIKFTLDGRKTTLFTGAEAGMPPTMRQTIRVGDVCITAIIQCVAKGSSLKCAVVP
ncbi:MAG: hypothetical protein ACRERC_06420 [Candidatus Binatia bacterium]